MAKDDRKIVRGVRAGDKTITDPDELVKVATTEQLTALRAQGYITGSWDEGKAKSADEGASAKGSSKAKN